MDLLGTPGECRQQAARCQALAETVSDQRVRALLVSMKEMWTKLAVARCENPVDPEGLEGGAVVGRSRFDFGSH